MTSKLDSPDNDEWKDKVTVTEKLRLALQDDDEGYLQVMACLTDEETDDSTTSTAWTILESLLSSPKVFARYAASLVKTLKTGSNDDHFCRKMVFITANQLYECDEPLPKDYHQKLDFTRLANGKVLGSTLTNSVRALLNLLSLAKVIGALPKVATSVAARSGFFAVDEMTGFISPMIGHAITGALGCAFVLIDISINVKRYRQGKITKKRCAKNIICSIFTVGAGIGGSYAGAAVGGAVGFLAGGPVGGTVGAAVGCLIGAYICSSVAGLLADYLAQKVFNLPKDEAVEKAYNFFGLPLTATNDEINQVYKRRCFENHPDKGGDKEKFCEVQVYMAVIKIFREEEEAKKKTKNIKKIEWTNDCLICWEAPGDIIFIPCGHICSCHTCATHLDQKAEKLCPVCRTPYTQLIKSYKC